MTGIFCWGSKTVKKGFLRDFFYLCFLEEFFTGLWFWRGSREFLFFAAFTGFFAGISMGQDFLRLQRIPPDSSGFLPIPVPTKRCLALASD
jgi:hypothetical protein